jgi:hypothetical protein
MATKRMGRGAVLLGLFLLLAGIAGAVVLYLLSGQQRDDAIRDLARAPAGCDTTLAFSDTGTFYIYTEHLGRLDTLDGDCETPDEYSSDADVAPRIRLHDDEGGEVELDRLDDEFTYTLGDTFAATARRQFEIETIGDYILTVESDDGNDFVVAVGRDPADAANMMKLGALGAGVAGVVMGLGLVLVGIRRGRRWRRTLTVYTARPPGWSDGAPMPTGPPVMQPPPLTQPMRSPGQPGQWSPAPPVGPPVVSPAQPPPSGPYAPAERSIPGPFAPPSVFAPPTLPAPPHAQNPIAPPNPVAPWDPTAPLDSNRDGGDGDDRGDGGDVRGDA